MSDNENDDNQSIHQNDIDSVDEDDEQQMDAETQRDDESDEEFEDDEDYEDEEDEYESGSYDESYEEYAKHRMDDDSEDSITNLPKYQSPFAQKLEFPNTGAPEAESMNSAITNNSTLSANSVNIRTSNKSQNSRPLPRIAMPKNTNVLNIDPSVGAAVFMEAAGQQSVHASGNQSTRDPNNKHLASSPLIMNSQEAVSNFFSQYIPTYYARNPWLLSSTFEIHQYKDLKNLNLYIYKTLRILQKDDINHPTQPRNIKMKQDLDWDLKIDRIASCYISKRLMTNVITYVSFPKDYDMIGLYDDRRDLSPNSRAKKPKKHLLGVIKSTQPYTMTASPLHSVNYGGMMANSVTHTPRTSGVGSALQIGRPSSASNNLTRSQQINMILQSPNIEITNTENNNGIRNISIGIKTAGNDGRDVEDYYSNDSDDDGQENIKLEDDDKAKEEMYTKFTKDMEERGYANNSNKKDRDCCKCFSIHNLRSSLVFGRNGCRSLCDQMVYTVFYQYGNLLTFLFIYALILTFGICERVYFPILPYENLINLDDDKHRIDNYMIMITGRIMLISLILMIISRMTSTLSWLNKRVGRFLVVRVILDNFFQHEYVHLILGWIGIIISCFIHIIFVLFTPFSTNGDIMSKEFGDNNDANASYVYSIYHPYEYHDNVYLYDILRIVLALMCILALILTNFGGTYYSLYSTSLNAINHKCWMKIKSVLCNKTFDYGHQKKRYKLLHITCGIIFLILFYLDLNYIGVYYVLTFFIVIAIIDRLYFLQFSKSTIYCTSDLNIIPIDHQFKLLFVNNNKEKMLIEPGDTFYISENKWSSFCRPAIFFSKNNYNSIGCIMRVHRNNTLSSNMERVKWNFNFLEKILDNEIKPIFRGPYRNNIYNRLLWNMQNKKFENKKYIQYLIAVDEGIGYQIEYLTYLQNHGYTKMPYPTHIIFATSSKSLFNYICTNLQLLFIEMEDLTVECKLLPSNINLIPNIDEMVDYYKTEKIKERNKNKKKQQQQQKQQQDDMDENDEDDEEKKDNNNNNATNEQEQNDDNEQTEDQETETTKEEEDCLTSHIVENEIMQEMEYDILHYLSIPHILYHHKLKKYYENHKNSKLSNKLNSKYNENHSFYSDDGSGINNNNNNNNNNKKSGIAGLINPNSVSPSPGESSYNLNEDIQIEMYYAGIPFVSNVLHNVCKICRIPYYTQKIY